MSIVQGHDSGLRYACQATSPLRRMLEAGAWPPDPAQLTIIKQNTKVSSGFLRIGETGQLFFKRFPVRAWRARLQRWRGQDRAASNWRISLWLRAQRVAIPHPHAVIWSDDSSWFITDALDNAATLQDAVATAGPAGASAALCHQAVAEVSRMHDAGVVHGDLKWGNLLVVGDRVMISDLDSARRVRSVGPRAAAPDLARFLVSGLEQGLDQSWAHDTLARYTTARRLKPTKLIGPVRRRVRHISRTHQRRYQRPPVALTRPHRSAP
ncbi:lipopolysaccharide kinase InaA family protein [Alkalilimnicola ehrlichii MLHE-1]|uniref:Mn2+-dependent serine/threonine protein kinase n=1 Tax=Alkalilimnicola ehrlichii (strain ATCC BAA-1101 / DSM 17681 / MLHE-1) TaxID=187272 RepID=Q0A4V1_ALKEH|nr:lipopolysaccharide kinase InaA family protein [Alkalilimnicola ehrlichii]ABI58136.1 Mn2+-dependent serine/threonine protein kinase [Alkalilimnicola ehrlichii MLHE-1]